MKRFIFPAIPFLLVFLAMSCGNKPDPSTGRTADTTAVETFTLSKGRLTTHLDLPGELRPFEAVDLYARVNSFVKDMYVDVGSEVRKGQLLATLEAPELEDALDASAALLHTQEALYRASKANYDRMYRTSKIPGTISPNELDMAYAKMGADSANLAAARSRYQESAAMQGYLAVRAPFDGVVSSRNIYPGASAGPAGKGSSIPLMTIQQQAKLRLVIAVPESATAYFRQNDTVHFAVQTLPGQQFTAFVSRLAGAMDMELRTEQLEMDVYNKDKTLLPGMFAKVSLDLINDKKVFVVPRTAVAANSKQQFVIGVSNGRAEWIPVQKGRENADEVEVFGNLQEGSHLIAAATDELKNGAPVKIDQK